MSTDPQTERSGGFHCPGSSRNLNLVVAESDRHDNIDICAACFGTEDDGNIGDTWRRRGNGVFADGDIGRTVAGVIVLRRADRSKPVSGYEALLLINERHVEWVDQIRQVIPMAGVMRYNMYP